MNGRTHKIRRRLSIVVLAASVAAIAIPTATAGPDPGDILGTGIVRSAAQVPNTPIANEFHLYPVDDWFRDAPVKSQTFTPSAVDRLPRADDKLFREILKDAALEHGASGFGNMTQAVRVVKNASSGRVHNYSHLPQEDRPSGITRRGI